MIATRSIVDVLFDIGHVNSQPQLPTPTQRVAAGKQGLGIGSAELGVCIHAADRARPESPCVCTERPERQPAPPLGLCGPAGRPLLLSKGRYAGLHEGVVRLPDAVTDL